MSWADDNYYEPPDYILEELQKEKNTMEAIVTATLAPYTSKAGKTTNRIEFSLDNKKYYIYANVYNSAILSTLSIGEKIEVEQKGDFWNLEMSKSPKNETTDEAFNKMKASASITDNTGNNIAVQADLLAECFDAMRNRLKEWTEDNVKCAAITLYIQLSKK